MRRFRLVIILLTILGAAAFVPDAAAQFKTEAFSNGFGGGDTSEAAPGDSAETLFSVKEYMAGLKAHDGLKIGTLAGGSAVFIGGQQIYHKQYWKLPVIYGGLGATVGGGFYFRNKYKTSLDAYNNALETDPNTTLAIDDRSKLISTCMFAGAAAIYWGTMMDGVLNYKTDNPHDAGKATLYSILVPGLGQAYNGEYWKIPIYWGITIGSLHFLDVNQTNYKRFKRIHNEASDPDGDYSATISEDTALYYRNLYRRYRDYSVLAVAASYLLQVIDANVFSYMQDFEVNDDISLHVTPTIISPDMQYAFSGGRGNALGLSLGLNF